MSVASGVIKRQWAMLKMIPPEPRRMSVREIEAGVYDQTGESIHVRSIQRDLEKLQDVFPGLACDKRGKEYGWYWQKQAERVVFPAMDGYTALSFRLMELYTKDLLPPVVRRHVQGYFTRAGSVLAMNAESALTRWQNLVRVVTRDVHRIPPRVSDDVATAVYGALLEGKRLKVVYQPADITQPRKPSYELNPLGLVLVNQVYYLVATAWDYDDVRQYALHRMRSAEKLATRAIPLDGFNLDEYLAAGEFEIPLSEKPMRVKLRMQAFLARQVEEVPIAKDQQAKVDGPDWKLITATVNDTLQLRWWILSLGNEIEVMAPKRLRKEIEQMLKLSFALYSMHIG
jgi:predicted DNA-binding transcriptional regulator YafY